MKLARPILSIFFGILAVPSAMAEIVDAQGPFFVRSSGSTYFTFLRKTPHKTALGNCIQNNGKGRFQDLINSGGSEEIVIAADGTFTYVRPVHITPNPGAPVSYTRRFLCTTIEETFDDLIASRFYDRLWRVNQFGIAVSCGPEGPEILYHEGITLDELGGGKRVCAKQKSSFLPKQILINGGGDIVPGHSLAPFYYTESPYGARALYRVYQGLCRSDVSVADFLEKCVKGKFQEELNRRSANSGLELLLGISSSYSNGGFIK